MRRQYGEISVTWVVCNKIAEHCGSLSATGVGGGGGAEISLMHSGIKRKSLLRREGAGAEYAPLSSCYTKGSAAVICRVWERYRSLFPQH